MDGIGIVIIDCKINAKKRRHSLDIFEEELCNDFGGIVSLFPLPSRGHDFKLLPRGELLLELLVHL